jgi:hypothetical protein
MLIIGSSETEKVKDYYSGFKSKGRKGSCSVGAVKKNQAPSLNTKRCFR